MCFIVYLLIPNYKVLDVVKLNGLIAFGFVAIEAFVFIETKGMYKRSTEAIQQMVYDKVFKHRTEDYFEFTTNLDLEEIDSINKELEKLDSIPLTIEVKAIEEKTNEELVQELLLPSCFFP